MSRIGKEPVAVPAGVTVTVDGPKVTVKGKLGETVLCAVVIVLGYGDVCAVPESGKLAVIVRV